MLEQLTLMLTLNFAQRALMAGLILAVLLATLGIFASVRRMAFFGDGIAHSSLAGIAIAILTGLSPLPVALVWAVIIALAIRKLEKSTRLPSDTLIGVLFTASMALGVTLMSFHRGYQPELVSFLFGSILAINPTDLIVIAALASVILVWAMFRFRQITFMSLSEDSARVAGINVDRQTDMLYVALALATVLGVKVLGVILVSALLIIPPATARLMAKSFSHYLAVSVAVGLVSVVIGLMVSFLYDLPSGAAIVLAASLIFSAAVAVKAIKTNPSA